MNLAIMTVASSLGITSATDVMMVILSLLTAVMTAFSIIAILAISSGSYPKSEYVSDGLMASFLTLVALAIFVAFTVAAPFLSIVAVAGILVLAGIILAYVKLVLTLAEGDAKRPKSGTTPLITVVRKRAILYKQLVWALALFLSLEIVFVLGCFMFSSTIWRG